jgi:hypothetical protein
MCDNHLVTSEFATNGGGRRCASSWATGIIMRHSPGQWRPGQADSEAEARRVTRHGPLGHSESRTRRRLRLEHRESGSQCQYWQPNSSSSSLALRQLEAASGWQCLSGTHWHWHWPPAGTGSLNFPSSRATRTWGLTLRLSSSAQAPRPALLQVARASWQVKVLTSLTV